MIIPFVNVICFLVLGIRGNEWAWRKNKWKSVQDFKQSQAKWKPWGIAAIAIGILFGITSGVSNQILRKDMGSQIDFWDIKASEVQATIDSKMEGEPAKQERRFNNRVLQGGTGLLHVIHGGGQVMWVLIHSEFIEIAGFFEHEIKWLIYQFGDPNAPSLLKRL